MANSVSLIITAKDNVIFHEDVAAITSFNEKGIFDVLPEHTNFITLIKDKIIVHKADGTNKEIEITNGVLRVTRDHIEIFIGLIDIPTPQSKH